MLEFVWNEESWALHSSGGLFWARENALLVADTHFGKGAALRSKGLAVPPGSTSESLALLDDVLHEFSPERLLVLGDFFHARASQSTEVLEALQHWRARWSTLQVEVLRGNHDRHAGDTPSSLGFTHVEEPYAVAGIHLYHIPPTNTDQPSIAGHIHPGIRLYGNARQKLRLPCLWIQPTQMILPAFGALTGLQEIKPRFNDRILVLVDGEAIEIPLHKKRE